MPTDGSNSSINIELGHESWARLLSGKISPEAAALSGELNVVRGSLDEFLMIMGVFDLWHVDTKNKVAVVTGAAVGLGRAYAVALAEAGVNLAVCDVRTKLWSCPNYR